MTTMVIEDDYHAWRTNAEGLVALARDFYGWVALEMPEEIERLEALIDTVEPLGEPDWEDFHEYLDTESDVEYWTLERMFEDL